MESETLSTQKFSRSSLDKVMTSRKMDVTISTEEIWRKKSDIYREYWGRREENERLKGKGLKEL